MIKYDYDFTLDNGRSIDAMNRKTLKLIYESCMLTLAIISVAFIWVEHPSLIVFDWIVWAVFLSDVLFRFSRSKNKLQYMKENPLDFIAIIPLDAIFRLARVARVFRVIRLVSMSSHFFRPVFQVLNTNGLNRVLTATFTLIFTASIPIYLIEPNISTYEDALWWSFVTATTVGYGDLSPETWAGRGIAVVLMVVGIGLLGMITGAIATYFIKPKQEQEPVPSVPTIEYIRMELDRYQDWTSEDIDRVIYILNEIRSTKERNVS